MKAHEPKPQETVLSRVFYPLLRLGFFALCAFAFPVFAAVEDICPEGASPRSDVKVCYDMDSLSNCITGREEQCLEDNNLADLDTTHTFRVMSDAVHAAAGSGYLETTGIYGGTSPGYTGGVFDAYYSEVRMRFYIRFDNGYLGYADGPHGPSLRASDGEDTCTTGGTLELSNINYYVYQSSSCGVAKDYLNSRTEDAFPLKNGRWYRIEYYRKIDTACTDERVWNGCNGVTQIWIDGTLVLSYTNLNLGGVVKSAKFRSYDGPRVYFHTLFPSWKGKIYFDNFVIAASNTAISEIGAASDENANLGSAITESPYIEYQGIAPFITQSSNTYQRKIGPDCENGSGFLGTILSEAWPDGTTYSSISADQNKGGVPDACSPAGTDKSYKINITNSPGQSGIKWARSGGIASGHLADISQQVIAGDIYLPTGNDNTGTVALTGFRHYACGANCDTAQYGTYVALTVNSANKWAIIERVDSGSPAITVESSTDVTFDTWHHFEIIVWSDQKVSLKIDGVTLFAKQALIHSVDWLFSGTTDNSLLAGVISFVGTPPFVVYYDNLSAGSVSFEDCDGWGADCPRAPTPTPTPISTSGFIPFMH